ncbi:hypothetical protein JCM6882_005865 [Rhodosporidiobolus microsporus]
MSAELRVEGEKVYEVDAQGNTVSVKGDYNRVQAGYKAASHNPSLTEETLEGAETTLHNLRAQHDDTGASSSAKPAATTSSSRKIAPTGDEYVVEGEEGMAAHDREVHQHRVVGGLKANLHRDDRSEETKDEIRKKLSDMGEEVE